MIQKLFTEVFQFFFRWRNNWELLPLLHSHAKEGAHPLAVRPLPIQLWLRRLRKRLSDSQRNEGRRLVLPMPKVPKSDPEIGQKIGDLLREMQSRWSGLGTAHRPSPWVEQRNRNFSATLFPRSDRGEDSGTEFGHRKTVRGTWELLVHPYQVVPRCSRVEFGHRKENQV